ncbi:MAG: hypothetical protein M0C28_40965 [Candidatus Moduliflexus flocculans]|nr:hypothetical protein [Candidatus Moduliflexus flocculans]
MDLGLSFEQPFWERLPLKLSMSIEAGWFFPGSAFERLDGSRSGHLGPRAGLGRAGLVNGDRRSILWMVGEPE